MAPCCSLAVEGETLGMNDVALGGEAKEELHRLPAFEMTAGGEPVVGETGGGLCAGSS